MQISVPRVAGFPKKRERKLFSSQTEPSPPSSISNSKPNKLTGTSEPPQFRAIHETLEVFNADLDKYVDLLAERITHLGGNAYGTLEAVSSQTTLEAYPTITLTWESRLEHFANVIALAGALCRDAIDATEQAGDAVTTNIYTGVAKGIDMWLWKVESHLYSK